MAKPYYFIPGMFLQYKFQSMEMSLENVKALSGGYVIINCLGTVIVLGVLFGQKRMKLLLDLITYFRNFPEYYHFSTY